MNTLKLKQDEHFTRNYQWIGLVVISLLSIPLHFTYEWLGKLDVVGIFTPINESIWEHLKLVYWPMMLWWGIGYLIFRNKQQLAPIKWLVAATVSVIVTMGFIVGWYYAWTNGIGISNTLIHVGSLFIAVPIGQLLSIHVYRVVQPRRVYQILSIILWVLFGAMFIYFTFVTPDMPIFDLP